VNMCLSLVEIRLVTAEIIHQNRQKKKEKERRKKQR